MMTTTQKRTPTQIRVYWSDHPRGWSYDATDDDGLIDSGAVDYAMTLDDAIDQACYELDVALTHDDFGTEPTVDGGCGTWHADIHPQGCSCGAPDCPQHLADLQGVPYGTD